MCEILPSCISVILGIAMHTEHDSSRSRLPIAQESNACVADAASATASIAEIFPRIPLSLFVTGAATDL